MPILAANDLLTPSVLLVVYCSLLRIYVEGRIDAPDALNKAALAAYAAGLAIADALFLLVAFLSLLHYALGSFAGLAAFLVEAGRWLFGLGIVLLFVLHLSEWRRLRDRFREWPGFSFSALFRDL
jgi:hypothetical protein